MYFLLLELLFSVPAGDARNRHEAELLLLCWYRVDLVVLRVPVVLFDDGSAAAINDEAALRLNSSISFSSFSLDVTCTREDVDWVDMDDKSELRKLRCDPFGFTELDSKSLLNEPDRLLPPLTSAEERCIGLRAAFLIASRCRRLAVKRYDREAVRTHSRTTECQESPCFTYL